MGRIAGSKVSPETRDRMREAARKRWVERRNGTVQIIPKNDAADYESYCMDIIDTAKKKGRMVHLFHLMHAFKLIECL